MQEFKGLPDWVCWVACDADGCWWGYEHEPNLADRSWYENEVGRSIRLDGVQRSMDWKKSLLAKPFPGRKQ